jgi:hypothetical protein
MVSTAVVAVEVPLGALLIAAVRSGEPADPLRTHAAYLLAVFVAGYSLGPFEVSKYRVIE